MTAPASFVVPVDRPGLDRTARVPATARSSRRLASRRLSMALVAACVLGLGACSGGAGDQPPTTPKGSTAAESSTGIPTSSAEPTTTPSPTPTAPAGFSADDAMADIETLAEIGPRLSTEPEFIEAADLVTERFEGLGYTVERPEFDVPAGDNWGTEVEAGTSQNVIAQPNGFDADEPYVIIGAHLDSIAVSPGAEDNASGVAITLELARMAAAADLEQVQFIAFGAEEPRGEGDDDHHYGSQQHVAEMSDDQIERVQAMISLDRVGVAADQVPICNGGPNGRELRDQLLDVAESEDVDAEACDSRASDHWSFDKAGMAAIRFGSVPYDGYHSEDDTPDVIEVDQLERVGTVAWAWLSERD